MTDQKLADAFHDAHLPAAIEATQLCTALRCGASGVADRIAGGLVHAWAVERAESGDIEAAAWLRVNAGSRPPTEVTVWEVRARLLLETERDGSDSHTYWSTRERALAALVRDALADGGVLTLAGSADGSAHARLESSEGEALSEVWVTPCAVDFRSLGEFNVDGGTDDPLGDWHGRNA